MASSIPLIAKPTKHNAHGVYVGWHSSVSVGADIVSEGPADMACTNKLGLPCQAYMKCRDVFTCECLGITCMQEVGEMLSDCLCVYGQCGNECRRVQEAHVEFGTHE
ncbi:hypothetical protein COLO4_07129 [Corchorus olitorius]|uniref:Uncharacterized protein n=1 Tax=Corchorus olitorius TaxID=93759 RepID=A0A1R3KKT0_9ROSI|nr:hypothetical protein COLO4_07129 [Corchorus olitorius]